MLFHTRILNAEIRLATRFYHPDLDEWMPANIVLRFGKRVWSLRKGYRIIGE